ncbi:uncharacterized protein CANTADRAFT_45801, partial [Suhomyces tanzawaensis NRRL Y-17324]
LRIALYFSNLLFISISIDLNLLICSFFSSNSVWILSNSLSCSLRVSSKVDKFESTSFKASLFSANWPCINFNSCWADTSSSADCSMVLVYRLMSFSNFLIAIRSPAVFSVMISIFCLIESTLEF